VIFRELPESRSAAQSEETGAPHLLVPQGFELLTDSINQKPIHINISPCYRPEELLKNYHETSLSVMCCLTVNSGHCIVLMFKNSRFAIEVNVLGSVTTLVCMLYVSRTHNAFHCLNANENNFNEVCL
jgi:hypothetical protein